MGINAVTELSGQHVDGRASRNAKNVQSLVAQHSAWQELKLRLGAPLEYARERDVDWKSRALVAVKFLQPPTPGGSGDARAWPRGEGRGSAPDCQRVHVHSAGLGDVPLRLLRVLPG